VGDAVNRMKELNIENIPVLRSGELIGAVSESGLFNIMLSNGTDIRSKKILDVIEPPYPVVSFDTAVERISSLISRENGAVLAKDESGNYHIVTKYDVLQSFRTKD
jgi:cystathionine beta-synthase